jgi:citrate synthase
MTETTASNGAELRIADGETLTLPPVSATEGAGGVDVGKLLSQGGVVTYDPGSCATAGIPSASWPRTRRSWKCPTC